MHNICLILRNYVNRGETRTAAHMSDKSEDNNKQESRLTLRRPDPLHSTGL